MSVLIADRSGVVSERNIVAQLLLPRLLNRIVSKHTTVSARCKQDALKKLSWTKSNLKNTSCNLWLIRHGETEWSRSGAHTGRTDLPLTHDGEVRAAAIGRYLARRRFALVLTSPLRRARETCRIAGYGDVAQIEPNLREWDYGVYEGRTSADIRKELPGWNLWTMGVVGGESIEQVADRAALVIDRACAVGGDAALFAHGHILRILTACWLGLPPGAGRLFALDTGCLSMLGYEHENHVISHWNQLPEAPPHA